MLRNNFIRSEFQVESLLTELIDNSTVCYTYLKLFLIAIFYSNRLCCLNKIKIIKYNSSEELYKHT